MKKKTADDMRRDAVYNDTAAAADLDSGFIASDVFHASSESGAGPASQPVSWSVEDSKESKSQKKKRKKAEMEKEAMQVANGYVKSSGHSSKEDLSSLQARVEDADV